MIGWINGLLITKRNIPPFVATLGMLIFVEGVRFACTRGVISGRPAPFVRVLASIIGSIPIPVVIMAVLAVIVGVTQQQLVEIAKDLQRAGREARMRQ